MSSLINYVFVYVYKSAAAISSDMLQTPEAVSVTSPKRGKVRAQRS